MARSNPHVRVTRRADVVSQIQTIFDGIYNKIQNHLKTVNDEDDRVPSGKELSFFAMPCRQLASYRPAVNCRSVTNSRFVHTGRAASTRGTAQRAFPRRIRCERTHTHSRCDDVYSRWRAMQLTAAAAAVAVADSKARIIGLYTV